VVNIITMYHRYVQILHIQKCTLAFLFTLLNTLDYSPFTQGKKIIEKKSLSYSYLIIPPASKKRGVYCFTSVRSSFRPSVRNTNFRHTFLSNYTSQPLDIWYEASVRGPTLRLPISDLSDIYFLFTD